MPFGEELGVGAGPRTESLKYFYTGSDNIRKRFTGYEKDDETGLDFAEARMYQNRHGRFTAPDPLLASASGLNPQTFNRYIYTGNDPINVTDPSGLSWCRNGAQGPIEWREGACFAKETNVDNRVQQCYAVSCDAGGGQTVGEGGFVWFDANGTKLLTSVKK